MFRGVASAESYIAGRVPTSMPGAFWNMAFVNVSSKFFIILY
jgi:hypothetical protein